MFLPIILSVSPNNKSGSILLSPKNSKVDPLRWHLSSISQQNLSPIFLSQYQNDKAGSTLCNNRQHYIVGVPQGSVFGPSVVLYISKKVFLFRDNFAFIFHLCNASYQLPRIFKNNGKPGTSNHRCTSQGDGTPLPACQTLSPTGSLRHCQQLHYLPPTCSGDPK